MGEIRQVRMKIKPLKLDPWIVAALLIFSSTNEGFITSLDLKE